MIPAACKRLAEVDFPIAEVSRHAAREKSIRHGHPSTLHLWWARRPLASSRAVLMALLSAGPLRLNTARRIVQGRGQESAARDEDPAIEAGPGRSRRTKGCGEALLKFIADFANWDNAAKVESSWRAGRALKVTQPRRAPGGDAPGGRPLRGRRLHPPGGIAAWAAKPFASDLNPVACLILKVMLEDIPRHGPGLADELRKVGGEIKAKAEKELADLYPKDPDGATPIAYLWARTVRCEAPDCGAEIPLMRSMWLCEEAQVASTHCVHQRQRRAGREWPAACGVRDIRANEVR